MLRYCSSNNQQNASNYVYCLQHFMSFPVIPSESCSTFVFTFKHTFIQKLDSHLYFLCEQKTMCGHHFQYCNTWQVYLHYLHMAGTHAWVCNFTICLMVTNSLYHQLDNTIVWPYFKQSNTNPVLASWSWVYWPDHLVLGILAWSTTK